MNPDVVMIWQARDGWRWRRIAPNGRQIAESGEAYTRRWSAKRAAKRTHRVELAAGSVQLVVRRRLR